MSIAHIYHKLHMTDIDSVTTLSISVNPQEDHNEEMTLDCMIVIDYHTV